MSLNSIDMDDYIKSHIDTEADILYDLDRTTHLQSVSPRMLSGHIQGNMLGMLVKLTGAKRILELGAFTGYSAISMALALPDDGEVITLELRDEMEELHDDFFNRPEVGGKVKIIYGDALETIPTLTGQFDLVFIDADKRLYSEYFDLVFDKLPIGGLIIADNILWDGKVVDPDCADEPQTKSILAFNQKMKNDPRVEVSIIPFRDGMSLIRKIAE